jgi:hypothetical protein
MSDFTGPVQRLESTSFSTFVREALLLSGKPLELKPLTVEQRRQLIETQ